MDIVSIAGIAGVFIGGVAAGWARWGRGNSRGAAGNADCPIQEHVTMLAAHQEAITTLKEGQRKIFDRLDELPREIVERMREAR